ncbi:MAG: hypothetical protein CM1200mP15_14800 [Dehalococcoidia bacterium]|nr:MAG: hypothetical protein CM1200mP15_14800 [Dehalococcoidia bacterium]
MGVGKDEEFNYSEDDVKACARAFTGWNIAHHILLSHMVEGLGIQIRPCRPR